MTWLSGSPLRGQGTPQTGADKTKLTGGSPLRGQGTLVIVEVDDLVVRFTPARAGNTQTGAGQDQADTAVHPCAGREHWS